MRLVSIVLFILSSTVETKACGLRAKSSNDALRDIASNYEAPATKDLPKAIISNSGSLVITNKAGEKITANENLALDLGMTITSKSGPAQIVLPATGQVIDLKPGTTLEVVELNKSNDQKICSVSFKMKTGHASFSSNHIAREKQCAPSDAETFEVMTNHVAITPVGTKYNVDLNEAIAELNGEEVGVDKGAVKIRLVKIKKEKKKPKVDIVADNKIAYEDQKAVVVKAGQKAKVKKGKKDRLADIQVIYPE